LTKYECSRVKLDVIDVVKTVSRKYAKVFWVLSIDTVVIEMIQLPLQIMFIGKIYRLSDVRKEKKKIKQK